MTAVHLRPPPCAGQWALFDSTEAADHREASRLCAECPIRFECASKVAELCRESGPYGQPEGTWAGQLYESPIGQAARNNHLRRNREREAAEEAAYTEEQARVAHRDYQKGFRDEWSRVGHRVYQRRQKRRQRSAA